MRMNVAEARSRLIKGSSKASMAPPTLSGVVYPNEKRFGSYSPPNPPLKRILNPIFWISTAFASSLPH